MHGLLIVDDNKGLATALTEYLSYLGFDTSAACDGAEAIAGMQASPDLPEAIVVEVDEPASPAVALIKALAGTPQWAQIPLVVTTGALFDLPDVKHASHILRKPIEMKNLVEILRQYCRQSA